MRGGCYMWIIMPMFGGFYEKHALRDRDYHFPPKHQLNGYTQSV